MAKIADLDITTDRGITVGDGVLTTDAMSVITDENVDLIVELVGGTTIARTFTLEALKQGKPVITANKALLADHGEEIYKVARENNTGIYYEAAVGGGIPILRSQRAGLIGNQIESIYGILNGTCNYILTRMEREGLPFDEILADAQALGYAETPPRSRYRRNRHRPQSSCSGIHGLRSSGSDGCVCNQGHPGSRCFRNR